MNTRLPRFTFAALALVATAATAADFHVAPNGNDADPGTKEKPFATPVRAMSAVRALVSTTALPSTEPGPPSSSSPPPSSVV